MSQTAEAEIAQTVLSLRYQLNDQWIELQLWERAGFLSP